MAGSQVDKENGAQRREKLTEEFLSKILSADSVAAPAQASPDLQRNYSQYLHQILDEKGISRADAIKAARLNSTFGWQIFEGTRRPGRDTALRLAFAMGLSLREANRLLTASGNTQLYCKIRRDAIIIFCLEHAYTLQQTDDALFQFEEETICDRG